MSLSGGYLPPGTQGKKSVAPRVIEDRTSLRQQLSQQRTSIDGSTWSAGVLAALQSYLFGLAIIVIPVLTTAAISTTLVNQEFEFGPSFGTGIGFWSLAHGSHLAVDGTVITLVPLGLTLVCLVAGTLSVRRTAKPGYLSCLWYVGTYLALTLITSLLVGASSVGSLFGVLATTLALALGSLALGLGKRQDAATFRQQIGTQLGRIPSWIRVGLKSGFAATGLVIVVGGLVLLVWILMGMDQMAHVLGQWSLDVPSGAAMGAAQMAVVPNLLVWATAWASGGSFALGQDTIISLTQTELGPLPALPALGALPAEPAWPIAQIMLPIVIAACAMVAGVLFARYEPRLGPVKLFAVPVISAATVTILFGALFALSSGVAGPERLAEVGVPILAGMGHIGLLALIGFVLLTLVARPEVREWVKYGWQKSIDRVTRVDEQDYVPYPVATEEAGESPSLEGVHSVAGRQVSSVPLPEEDPGSTEEG